MSQRIIEESELASLAQNFRENAGKTRTQAARELGVAHPTPPGSEVRTYSSIAMESG